MLLYRLKSKSQTGTRNHFRGDGMPDFNSLSDLYAKIFIVLFTNMKNLSQPSCFFYK